jgi:predicted component of type VI protein secretion system
MYMDRPLNYSMLFIIRWDTIPPARLGFDLDEGRWDAARLGYTCWIGSAKEKFTTLSRNRGKEQ